MLFLFIKFYFLEINSGLGIEIEAPFFDDPAPDSDPGKQQAFLGLWDYEVVEIFFLASSKNEKEDEMYLELEFGPHGHHLGLLLHGRRNCLIHSFPITYKAKIGMYLLTYIEKQDINNLFLKIFSPFR